MWEGGATARSHATQNTLNNITKQNTLGLHFLWNLYKIALFFSLYNHDFICFNPSRMKSIEIHKEMHLHLVDSLAPYDWRSLAIDMSRIITAISSGVKPSLLTLKRPKQYNKLKSCLNQTK